jgi:cytochrome b6-f complex iron-sulfur subunit
MDEANFFVFRDEQGIYAISGVCTHLGCSVGRSPEGFACPCHGSRFADSGDVTRGPAPRALPWLEVGRAADGQLVVYAENEVPAGTRFRVYGGTWARLVNLLRRAPPGSSCRISGGCRKR